MQSSSLLLKYIKKRFICIYNDIKILLMQMNVIEVMNHETNIITSFDSL